MSEETIISDRLKNVRCPYRQDLKIFCLEKCGYGASIDCPIWLKEAEVIEGRYLNAQVLGKKKGE